jgi:hypothetical protein
MNSLLEHGVADRIAPILCAFERGRTEREDSDCGCEMRHFVPRSGEERGSSLPVDGIAGKQRDCVQMRVSPVPFRLLLGHCFGAYATPGGKLALLLLRFPSKSCSERTPKRFTTGPPQMQSFGLGSRAHSHGFAQV